jgi:hypothetical protein
MTAFRRAALVSALLLGATLGGSASAQTLYVTEFMASNDAVLEDEDGDHSDWLELHNPGPGAVNLAGWRLTDDASNLAKWVLPGTNLPAGGYLVVFASNKNRAVAGNELHTNFALSAGGEYLAVVRPDATVSHAYAPSFPPQRLNISYGLTNTLASEQCFTNPTPGAANDDAMFCAFVDDPQVSVERGFYDAPFTVAVSTTTPGATLRYTVDGSAPTDTHGTVYSGPIPVNTTTVLRVAGFKPTYNPSTIIAHTYLFLDDVIQQTGAGFPTSWNGGGTPDYAMDPDVVNGPLYQGTIVDDLKAIPSMSLVMDIQDLFGPDGLYPNSLSRGVAFELRTSVELLFPDGQPGFQVNCGIRIHGGTSRALTNPKHSFRLLFKPIYGPSKLDFPLFPDSPVASFDKIVLRAGHNHTWVGGDKASTYLNDQFTRDAQLAMGQASAHGTFVHLYLNGLYWGLFNPTERLDADFVSSYFGGSDDDWDVLSDN